MGKNGSGGGGVVLGTLYGVTQGAARNKGRGEGARERAVPDMETSLHRSTASGRGTGGGRAGEHGRVRAPGAHVASTVHRLGRGSMG